MMKCNWCGEPLHFVAAKGYVHADGQMYKQREVPCHNPDAGRQCTGSACKRCKGTGTIMIDDHCAMAVPA